MTADRLFDVKNAFYIGNYQSCINETQRVKPLDLEQKKCLDVLLYRSYIAQKKYNLVIGELDSYSGPEEVKCLRLLAEYLNAEPQNRSQVLKKLETQLSSFASENTTLPIVAATIYLHEKDTNNALKVLYNCDSLEAMALAVQCYLYLDRLDLATNQIKRMAAKDEDAPLTQLCSGWLHLALGGDKLQEAFYIFTEMAEKNSKTPLLSVGLASVLIAQGKFEEADSVLAESLEKDPNHLETVINQVVVSQFTGKCPEVCTRLLSQLKNTNMNHPFVQEYQQKEQQFQELCQTFSS